jgi:hypothetical protein
MKPNKEGIYKWIDNDGIEQEVHVLDVSKPYNIEGKPWLRVYYQGGYYNVHDECVGTEDEPYCKSEWPDRWGEYVGPIN